MQIFWQLILMRYYFQLQFLRFNRILIASGFHPTIMYFLMVLVFVTISHITINTLEKGNWIYGVITIYLFSKFHNPELISLIFSKHELRKLRIVEAFIFSIPFSTMLFFYQFYLSGVLLFFVVLLFSQISFYPRISFVIPTPFYKRPFEFITGFRIAWPLLFVTYSLQLIAMEVGNYNLAVFSFVVICFTLVAFYAKPEDQSFIFIFASKPEQFLLEKTKTAALFSALLSLPLFITMTFAFPEHWLINSILFLLGLILPIVGVLNKYAHFPLESELINSLLIGFCLLFPPLFLFIIPYLYNKATINLKNYL